MTAAPADDSGSGSVLAIALIAALVGLTGLSLPLYLGFAARQAAAGAADAAALAAADAAAGFVAGAPCDLADRVAVANGALLSSCDVDGLVVTVSASRWIVGLEVAVRATAGPARSGVD